MPLAASWVGGRSNIFSIHPWKLTWNLQIPQLKRNIIFQSSISWVQNVNFPGCILAFALSTGAWLPPYTKIPTLHPRSLGWSWVFTSNTQLYALMNDAGCWYVLLELTSKMQIDERCFGKFDCWFCLFFSFKTIITFQIILPNKSLPAWWSMSLDNESWNFFWTWVILCSELGFFPTRYYLSKSLQPFDNICVLPLLFTKNMISICESCQSNQIAAWFGRCVQSLWISKIGLTCSGAVCWKVNRLTAKKCQYVASNPGRL